MKNPFEEEVEIYLQTEMIEPDSWGCITEGYYWAIKLLFEGIEKSNKYQNRWVAYPIMFNIRHYYELSLKDILVNIGIINNVNLLQDEHNLKNLLEDVGKYTKKYLEKNKEIIGPRLIIGDFETSYEAIKHEMQLFIEYDNNSFSFRYPYTKKGTPALKEKLKFNKKELYRSVMRCRNELTKISAQLICDENNRMFDNDK